MNPDIPNIHILDTFTLENIPDLDVAVLGALELFEQTPPPPLNFSSFKRPLVVGSGNAEVTSRIIFEDVDAVYASESTFEEKLDTIETIDSVVVVSASGGKHAPIVAEAAKKKGKLVALITNTENSEAARFADHVFVYPKNREPYTYNTSTYMGMILGKTGENPTAIRTFIENLDASLWSGFGEFNKFYLVVPPQFEYIKRMLEVKFIELFGRRIAREVETMEYLVRHATTVVPSEELFISFGEEQTMWGTPETRRTIPLPKDADYGAMMAVGYYIISQIQKQHLPFFKENIATYTKKVSEEVGIDIRPIVEK